MEANVWVELLFKYGPYAVLALFVLWVAPRQTRQFVQCRQRDAASRYLCGAVAAGCWGVVGLMVVFIYQAWTPRTAYTGTFGTYGEQVQFIPLHEKFFVSTQPLQNGRLRWNFAIVSDLGSEGERYEFTHVWGEQPLQFTDYEIAADLLAKGSLRFFPDADDPSALLFDDDGNPATSPRRLRAIGESYDVAGSYDLPRGLSGWMAAYAADLPDEAWIKALGSRNRYFQAQARRKMRRLKDSELRAALQTDELTDTVRKTIKQELRRRQR